jgi:hypothetical protein
MKRDISFKNVANAEKAARLPIMSFGSDGLLTPVALLALQQSLAQGSLGGVLELLQPMDSQELAQTLTGGGFKVSFAAIGQGSEAILASIEDALIKAVGLRVDGFGLAALEGQERLARQGKQLEPVAGSVDGSRSDAANGDPLAMIKTVMGAATVSVELLGDAPAVERKVLLMIGGQALQAGVQGFGFDGVPGKYVLQVPMKEVRDLYAGAAGAVALESAGRGMGAWVAGERSPVNAWVPDSFDRLLHGALSVQAAQIMVEAMHGGSIAKHASEIGFDLGTKLLTAQGLDVDSLTIIETADELGLAVIQPVLRGRYFGPVVAVDHQAVLVKVARNSALAVKFSGLPEGQEKPVLGQSVNLLIKNGAMTVSVSKTVGREAEIG